MVWKTDKWNEVEWNEMEWNKMKYDRKRNMRYGVCLRPAAVGTYVRSVLCELEYRYNCNTIWLWISVVLYSERKCCCKVTQIIFPTFVRGNNTYQMFRIILVIINSQRNLVMYNIHAYRNRMFNFDHVVCLCVGGGGVNFLLQRYMKLAFVIVHRGLFEFK